MEQDREQFLESGTPGSNSVFLLNNLRQVAQRENMMDLYTLLQSIKSSEAKILFQTTSPFHSQPQLRISMMPKFSVIKYCSGSERGKCGQRQ